MKNFIKIIGLASVILVGIFACKKDEVVVKKEERFSIDINLATDRGTTNAIIIGTKAELKTSLMGKDGAIYLKKVSSSNNVFVPIDDQGPMPGDPMKACHDEISAYYAANIDAWQQVANQNCRNFMACITCPNAGGGLYVMYLIKPNSPKCTILEAFEAQFNLAAFKFTDGELESEAVAAHIKNK